MTAAVRADKPSCGESKSPILRDLSGPRSSKCGFATLLDPRGRGRSALAGLGAPLRRRLKALMTAAAVLPSSVTSISERPTLLSSEPTC